MGVGLSGATEIHSWMEAVADGMALEIGRGVEDADSPVPTCLMTAAVRITITLHGILTILDQLPIILMMPLFLNSAAVTVHAETEGVVAETTHQETNLSKVRHTNLWEELFHKANHLVRPVRTVQCFQCLQAPILSRFRLLHL